MSLINCPECKKEISSKAASCPSCGAPISGKKQKAKSNGSSIGCFSVILIAFFIYLIWPSDNSSNRESKKPLTPAEIRKQKIEKQFSAWDGAHRDLERLVKMGLKDPDSYQHIDTFYRDNGESLLIEMNYRAKNSFGGYVVDRVLASYDINGALLIGPISCNEVPDSELCQ